jgi:F-type H+-transporting ATPase subunit epsilon
MGNLTHFLCISWGFAEVLPDRVIILAQTAERAEEIDVDRARRAKGRAEERLRKVSDFDIDMERARVALERSLVRLQVAGRVRN